MHGIKQEKEDYRERGLQQTEKRSKRWSPLYENEARLDEGFSRVCGGGGGARTRVFVYTVCSQNTMLGVLLYHFLPYFP